jgi:tetratricopeptide (TPR) repeat protein
MPNRKVLRQQKQAAASQSSNLDRLQDQLQKLIQKKNYRQAIEKAKNIKKMHPDAEIKPSEAEIWALQGRQEYTQGNHRQAQNSLQQAVALGCGEETYYWLTKSLLATGNSATALETMRKAFESQVLTKDYAGCYLKLLFLQGASAEVSELLKTQAKRFSITQTSWANGVLALQAKKLPEALQHFQKMGSNNATPSDSPSAWIAYTYQQLGHWELAEKALGITQRNKLSTPLPTHPAIGRLSMVQAVSPAGSSDSVIPINPQPGKQRILSFVLRLIQLLDESQYHKAAHALQKIPYPCLDFPEVNALHRQVMIVAADQALKEDDIDCIVAFLETTVYQPPFDVQLVLKLLSAYRVTDAPAQEIKRLLNYLIAEVKQLAKAQPQNWPEAQLNSTLAHIHCWLTDAWINEGYRQQAYKALQVAEQLYPDSPEVIGRKGLMAYLKDNHPEAIALLTKALEGGCRYMKVYVILLRELEHQGDRDAIKDIKRRFGKLFEDVDIDEEVEIPRWIEALSSQDYRLFTELVSNKKDQDAALQACRIFMAAVAGEATATGRVGFKQEQAIEQWEQLLQKVTAPEQIQVIQAAFLAVQLFAKRQKGIAAWQTEYLQRLSAMSGEHPEAQLAYLAMWAIKGDRAQLLATEIRSYLSRSSQPGKALAEIQLHIRRYTQTESIRPLIDEFLQRDAQNPLLLLAKATTYSIDSKNYTELKEQGFELARRLQDASALQAYREEKAIQAEFQSRKMTTKFFTEFMEGDDLERLNVAKSMISDMFGDDLPPGALEKMLPTLMNLLEENIDDDDDNFYDDEEDDDYYFIPRPLFGGIPVRPTKKPPKRPSAKKKRK